MPEYQFRQMNEDLLEKDYLKQRLAEIPKPTEDRTVQAVLLGFLAGSLTVIAINKIGSR